LDNEEVERIVKEIEAEKEAEAERKKNRMAAVAQVSLQSQEISGLY
jgi:hypothetical protein